MQTRDGAPVIEYRTLCRAGSVGATDEGRMSGKAAPFGSQTMIGSKPWGFREQINPSAFNKSIADGDIVLLDNHDTSKPIARMSAGTLRIEARGDGAYWDADPVDTSYAKDAAANIRSGNYGGCSFGFEVIKDKWSVGEDGVDERELLEVKVHEISTVTFPAYADTEASMRDAVTAAKETRPEPKADQRDDPDGEEYSAIDKAVGILKGSKDPAAIEALKGLEANQKNRSEDIPLDEQAAILIRMYNELPEDQRAEVRALFLEKTSEPDDESTRKDEEREMALMSHRAWAHQPR